MRTILLFLEGIQIDEIEAIRKKHDPLFGLIQPHITLVFPFESAISNDELRAHIARKLEEVHPIEIELIDCISHEGNYLFLRVEKGTEQIRKLHDELYKGPLAEFLRSDIPYIPHVTVGRKENEKLAMKIAEKMPKLSMRLQCIIEKLTVERIGEGGKSIIEFEIQLQK
ncbi:2'-5' RNA ligase family protein [Bacillus bingmayongensis]|uniref:2'-5' RNA ligase family protein n=1 Tax=Bacillus bingmayongensis TaxID=1150157 RepID=UPI001C8E99A4|nr:2'-5' RNA ligase family protein [Bacillus bingmayongensis]MBY0597620.1 2'-5' RNA ligase family protein [Bacillus bingmayongensis]